MPAERTTAGAAHKAAAEAVNQARRSGWKRGSENLLLSHKTIATAVNSP